MTLAKLLQRLGGAAVLIGLASSASANSDHWDKFSCYAYVHDQCYGNGQEPCSSEGYEWGLNECDAYYPSLQGTPPSAALGLTSKPNDRKHRMIIKRSFNNAKKRTLK